MAFFHEKSGKLRFLGPLCPKICPKDQKLINLYASFVPQPKGMLSAKFGEHWIIWGGVPSIWKMTFYDRFWHFLQNTSKIGTQVNAFSLSAFVSMKLSNTRSVFVYNSHNITYSPDRNCRRGV